MTQQRDSPGSTRRAEGTFLWGMATQQGLRPSCWAGSTIFSPLIAAQFLNPGTLFPDQGHMVFMKKFSVVSHGAVKGPGSFQNRLDVKAAFSVAPVDAVQQGLEGVPPRWGGSCRCGPSGGRKRRVKVPWGNFPLSGWHRPCRGHGRAHVRCHWGGL